MGKDNYSHSTHEETKDLREQATSCRSPRPHAAFSVTVSYSVSQTPARTLLVVPETAVPHWDRNRCVSTYRVKQSDMLPGCVFAPLVAAVTTLFLDLPLHTQLRRDQDWEHWALPSAPKMDKRLRQTSVILFVCPPLYTRPKELN